MKTTLLSLSILALGLISPIFAAAEVGKPADSFTLSDTKGKSHSLADFKGKYVVLEWYNSECPFVKKHYDSNNMQKLQKDYTDKGVVWLSINSSAEGKQGHFSPEEFNKLIKEKKSAPTALLLDHDGKVGKLYGAKTTPHIYIINPEGSVIYQGAIDSKSSADQADIASSENYVKTTLDAAMAGKKVETTSTKPYGCSVKY
jgi:peroxiredoxin